MSIKVPTRENKTAFSRIKEGGTSLSIASFWRLWRCSAKIGKKFSSMSRLELAHRLDHMHRSFLWSLQERKLIYWNFLRVSISTICTTYPQSCLNSKMKTIIKEPVALLLTQRVQDTIHQVILIRPKTSQRRLDPNALTMDSKYTIKNLIKRAQEIIQIIFVRQRLIILEINN